MPQLLAVIQGPKNDNQKALAYYLLGDADPALYEKLLLHAEVESPGEFFPAFRYLNSEGLKKLAAERVHEIKQTFLRCKGRIEKPEEAEAINDLLQSIP